MLTAGCFLYRSWEALLIGTVGAIIACISMPLIDKMRIDDPVGASSVHGNDISVSINALSVNNTQRVRLYVHLAHLPTPFLQARLTTMLQNLGR
jgi:hypothetical protein